jgi:hypothetical protein
MANTIDSELQLTTVLDTALVAFKRAILPLTLFSTVFRNVQLQGTNKIAVPYYPLSTSSSQTRAADGSYKALATATDTQMRDITLNKNKVQAISFTSEEINRQPAFNPAMHGRMKGEKLAFDILADILSVVKASAFTGTTIADGTSGNFDEDDVADLGKICMDDFWPEAGRGLALSSGHYYNLLKQPAIIDGSQSGSFDALREAMVRRLMGFDIFGSAGVPTNNGTAFAVLGEADDEVFTAVAHGFAVGDRIRFPAVVGGTGLTADTGRYYVKTVPTADTFTISETLGGATKTISADATAGTTVQAYENIAGMAVLPSAIGVAFAPVQPSGAMRSQLADYRIVDDPESGIALEYKHLVYPDTDQEVQVIEAHYGYATMETAALKILRAS